MNRSIAPVLILALAASGCVSPVNGPADSDPALAAAYRQRLADDALSTWSSDSALAARALMEQYGTPDEVHYGQVVWNGNRPWRRTVARDVRPLYVPGDELGLVEQSVAYAPLTPEQAARLAAFDPKVTFDPKSGLLTARSDREAVNILRLNLADDVVHHRVDADQARADYARILSLESSGKTSSYLMSLRFTPGL